MKGVGCRGGAGVEGPEGSGGVVRAWRGGGKGILCWEINFVEGSGLQVS